MNRLLVSLLLLIYFLSAPDISAQDPPSGTTQPSNTGVQWSLGFGAISSPRPYVGTDNKVTPIPLLEVYYKRLYVQGIQAGYHLVQTQKLSLDARAGLVFAGLDPDDSPQLQGMVDRKSTVEGGFVLDWTPSKYKLSTSAYTDLLGRSDGHQAAVVRVIKRQRARSPDVPSLMVFGWSGLPTSPSFGAKNLKGGTLGNRVDKRSLRNLKHISVHR